VGKKTKTFNMRMSPDEWAQFEALAERRGLPIASLVRMLVRNEQAAISCSEERCRHGPQERLV
jgi:hypothetical protein